MTLTLMDVNALVFLFLSIALKYHDNLIIHTFLKMIFIVLTLLNFLPTFLHIVRG